MLLKIIKPVPFHLESGGFLLLAGTNSKLGCLFKNKIKKHPHE